MRSTSVRKLKEAARKRRRGAAVLETIISMPVLIAAVFSIVEFSMLVNRQQHMVEACRNGALVASRLEPEVLKASTKGAVPSDVRSAVTGRLAEANIEKVDIQFSFDRAAHVQVAAMHAAHECRASVEPLGQCVRVAISVPATELSPNLLQVFGFDISQRKYSAAAVFPYER